MKESIEDLKEWFKGYKADLEQYQKDLKARRGQWDCLACHDTEELPTGTRCPCWYHRRGLTVPVEQ